MANLSKFPLLLLPQLAKDRVLTLMVPFDLFNMSKVSKQCKSIIKTFSKNFFHKNYRIRLSMYQNPEICFSRKQSIYRLTLTDEVEKDGTRCPLSDKDIGRGDTYVYSDSGNLMKDCMDLFMDIKEILNVRINRFVFFLHHFAKVHPTILEWLNTKIETIDIAHVLTHDVPVARLEQFLRNLTNAKKLLVFGQTCERGAFNIPDHFESVAVIHGDGFKLVHFFILKTPIVNIYNTKLTNADLNLFLKRWINMTCNQKLKKWEVEILKTNDMATVLQGIPHEIGHPDRVSYRGRDHQQLDGGFDIVRKDGLRASLFVYRTYHCFVMFMTTQLANAH